MTEVEKLQSEKNRLQTEVLNEAEKLSVKPTEIAEMLAASERQYLKELEAVKATLKRKHQSKIKALQSLVTKMTIAEGHAITLKKING
jgi:hypothetical protein